MRKNVSHCLQTNYIFSIKLTYTFVETQTTHTPSPPFLVWAHLILLLIKAITTEGVWWPGIVKWKVTKRNLHLNLLKILFCPRPWQQVGGCCRKNPMTHICPQKYGYRPSWCLSTFLWECYYGKRYASEIPTNTKFTAGSKGYALGSSFRNWYLFYFQQHAEYYVVTESLKSGISLNIKYTL